MKNTWGLRKTREKSCIVELVAGVAIVAMSLLAVWLILDGAAG